MLPPPGKIPTLTSGSPNVASRDATIRSHASASSNPPASANPSTAAITGTGSSWTRVISRTISRALRAQRVVVEPRALLEVHPRREGTIPVAR